MRNHITKQALCNPYLEVHMRDRLIECSSAFFERLDPLFREIFASRIGTYACDFDFLIEVAVSPTMMGVNELPPGCPYITYILRREAITPGEPSIVINDDQEPFVLLAEGAYRALEEVSMHEIKGTLASDESRLIRKGFSAHLASFAVIASMHVLRTERHA
jgi:hypothetical protein